MPKIDDVAIGDFSKSVVPKSTTPASPERERLEQAEEKLTQQATSAEKELKPLEAYEDRLKEIGVNNEEAAQIVDAVLMQGYYADDVPITKRVRLRLRTRTYRDTKRAQDYIERVVPKYDAHYNEIMSRFSLAASIEQFGPNKFDHPRANASAEEIEKSFENRLAFVDSLLEPVLRTLYVKLFKFDQKLRVVLEEGALQNF